jgi:aerobic carbon-monoxide dehydrogenase medium subunit
VKPAPFAYWDPPDLASALAFLAEHSDDSTLLAGGQSLLPLVNMRLVRPDYLIDLGGVSELMRIEEADGGLRLGALCSHDDLLQSPVVRDRCPLLTKALPYVGHMAIRHRGTLGGSLAHADPAAELPAVAVALDAEITLRSASAVRTVPARDFFLTHLTTAIEPGEILTDVRLPRPPDEPTGTAVMELARRHGDFALVGVAAQLSLSRGTIGGARLCAFGVDQVPRRLVEVEAVLLGERPAHELLAHAAGVAAGAVRPPSDMHASAVYRRRMCGVMARRALQAALNDARGARS